MQPPPNLPTHNAALPPQPHRWIIAATDRPTVGTPTVRLSVATRRRQVRHTLIAVSVLVTMTLASVGAAARYDMPMVQALQGIAALSFLPLDATALPPPATATPWPALPGPGGDSAPHAYALQPFLCAALPWARYASRAMTYGPDAEPYPWYVSVILGQWIAENGANMPTARGYNFGNVSAIAGFPSTNGVDSPNSPARFAFGTTPQEGVAEYLIFARDNHGYYGAISLAYPSGPIAQAIAIGESPWDATHYTNSGHPGKYIFDIITSDNLVRFDNLAATC